MTALALPRYNPQCIPNELKEQRRWCVFQVTRLANGKLKKTPLIPGVRPIAGARTRAACNDPRTWRSFEDACADADVRGLYLGFALERDLDMTFVDLDDSIGPDGAITTQAQLIVDTLDSYTEVSVSGTGLHALVRGLADERFTLNGFEGRIEVYPRRGGHFMLVTGDTRPGLGSFDGSIEERTAELTRLFPARPDNGGHHAGAQAHQEATTRLSEADEDAIVAWVAPFWTDGRRHHMALYLSGYLGKQGVPRDQAVGILERCAASDADPGAKTHAAHDTYDALEAGEEVSGYHGLCDVCGLTDDELASLDTLFRTFRQATRAPVERDAHNTLDRALGQTEVASPAPQADRKWPELDPAALHGLAGDIVRAIDPHTEGDPVALLINTIAMVGSAVGRTPHVQVGATRHGINTFFVLVGKTSRSRKGTAHDESLRIVALADPFWKARVLGGLSSGEGLIYAVRDATYKIDKEGKSVLDDAGVEDKRLCVVEPEFASVLKVGRRDGNTLTEILRRAWDGNDLRTLTRSSPLVASNPHITLIGHITEDELRRTLDDTSQTNGYFNRFAVASVKRSKLLPHGGSLPDAEVAALGSRMQAAISDARKRSLVERSPDARAMWERVYPELTKNRPGMIGAITARAEAHALRFSLLYALLDGSDFIEVVHLEAALALWEYCEDSVRYIFGDATGDFAADRVLAAIRNNPEGMTQNALVDLFGRNLPAAKLKGALETLVRLERVTSWQQQTGGRPSTVWQATS